jgi:hypothetical protein
VSSIPVTPRAVTRNPYPSIPEPTSDLASMLETIKRLKEAVELMTGQRGTQEVVEQQSLQGVLTEVHGLGSRTYDLSQATDQLARRVIGVEATSEDVSASGQIVISAEANPAGYKAYFGVYLRANADSVPGTEREAGMHLGLTNADSGVFALDVGKFLIRDSSSGTTSTVFQYSGGVFTMTGNVTINGNLMVTNTITGAKLVDLTTPTEKVAYNAVGQFYQTTGGSWSFGSGWNTVASRTIVGITGGYVFLLGVVTVNAAPAGSTTFGVRIRRTSDGSIIKEAPLSVMASGDYAVAGPVTTTIGGFHSDGGSNYTYELQVNTGGVSLTGTLVEFSVEVRKR